MPEKKNFITLFFCFFFLHFPQDLRFTQIIDQNNTCVLVKKILLRSRISSFSKNVFTISRFSTAGTKNRADERIKALPFQTSNYLGGPYCQGHKGDIPAAGAGRLTSCVTIPTQRVRGRRGQRGEENLYYELSRQMDLTRELCADLKNKNFITFKS